MALVLLYVNALRHFDTLVVQHVLFVAQLLHFSIEVLFIVLQRAVLLLEDRILLLCRLKLELDVGQFRLIALKNALLLDLRFGLVVQYEFLHELVPITDLS